MTLSGLQPAFGRRAFVALGVATAVVCAASGLRAQPPQTTAGQGQQTGQPAQTPAQPAAPDQFKLTSDAAMFVNFIKPEKAADFEEIWKTMRTKLQSSDKPDWKALGDALKFYKLDGPAAPQGVTYIFFSDPTAKVSYDPGKILYESGLWERADADALYGKVKDCYNQILPWPLISLNK